MSRRLVSDQRQHIYVVGQGAEYLHLKYCSTIMAIPKMISIAIMLSKYFPAEPTFILEYNLPSPEKTTTRPMK